MNAPRLAPVPAGVVRPRWSIMIPCCDPDPDMLRETIESVLHSGLDRSRAEIVLVDDGTEASVFAGAASIAETHQLRVVRNPSRTGLVGNWNRCLTEARGELVHLLHQDDRILPGFYEAMEAGFAARPDIGAAFCRVGFIDRAGNHRRVGHMPDREPGVLKEWVEHFMVNLVVQCPCIVVARRVYETIGMYRDQFDYCTDYDMWQRIGVAFPVWYEPRLLAEYREHAASATNRLFRLGFRWAERRACLRDNVSALPSPVRETAYRSARHYQARLAATECRIQWRARPWHPASLAAILSLLRFLSPRDLWWIGRRRFPRPVPGVVPERDETRGERRSRILLLTEFFPADPATTVFGVFQRLRRLFDASARVGKLNVVFLWPDNFQFNAAQTANLRKQIESAWPVEGDVQFVTASSGAHAEVRKYPVRSAWWLWRGACSFMHSRPTLRTAGLAQVARLRELLLTIQPDLIVCHRIGAMAPFLRMGGPLPPLVLDLDDIDHVKVARIHGSTPGLPAALVRSAWTLLARRAERASIRRADLSTACSQADFDLVRPLAPRADLRVLPNTVAHTRRLPVADRPVAMFVGIAPYPPNREAMRRLVRTLWPRVRARVPDAVLLIAGGGSAALLKDEECTGVEVLDFVSDLDAIYARARIALCPVMAGSGTRIKIIEAAFRGRPVVSTAVGAEGLRFEDGKEILLADTDDAFADAVCRLFRDVSLCARLADAAYARAAAEYDPGAMVDCMAGWMRDLLPRGTGEA